MNSNRLSSYLAMAAVPTAAAGFAHADNFYSYSYGESPLSINLDNTFGSNSDVFGGEEDVSMTLGDISLTIEMAFVRGVNSSNSNSYASNAGFYFDGDGMKGGSSYSVLFHNIGKKAGARFDAGDVINDFSNSSSMYKLDNAAAAHKLLSKDDDGDPIIKSDGKFGSDSGEELGYLGFSIFDNDGILGSGWLSIGLNLSDGIFNLYGWGVGLGESPILAGQTSGANPVPGPAGIFALAAGAAGIRRKRSRIS